MTGRLWLCPTYTGTQAFPAAVGYADNESGAQEHFHKRNQPFKNLHVHASAQAMVSITLEFMANAMASTN
eukprot:1137131-Pelagomonas_calceolata.AAC.2